MDLSTLPFAPVLFIIAFLIGLGLLERGADIFTDNVGELVETTGASETMIGLITAGLEWEELIVCLVAALSGSVDIALGDIIGSNIANITGSFALGPLIRPIQTRRDDRLFGLLMLGITLLVCGLLWSGEVGRSEGTVLLVLFAVYIVALLYLLGRHFLHIEFADEDDDDDQDGEEERAERNYSSARSGRYILLAFVGLALILVGAEAVVQAGLYFARLLHISEFVIGVTMVALGTTLPDKVISFAGALRGRSGIVTANAIGSNIFNLLFVLGITALVQPLALDSQTRAFDVPFLLGSTLLLTLLLFFKKIGRLAGIVLLALYIFYLVYNLVFK